MKQIFVSVFLVLTLGACSIQPTGNSSGVARIRATALAAQQRNGEREGEREVTQPTSAPVEIAAQSQPPIQVAEATQDDNGDGDGKFAFALTIVIVVFLTGCITGAILTAYALGQKEVKRGSASAR